MTSKCFFSNCYDDVSCSEHETWLQLSELKKRKNDSKTFQKADNLLEVALLRADFFYQHKFDLEASFICDLHREVLLSQVHSNKSFSSCDMCSNIKGTSSRAKSDLRHVTIGQAITLFEQYRIRNSYGKLICRQCRAAVSSKTENAREILHIDAFECLFDVHSSCCLEDPMEDNDVDYHPPFDHSGSEEQRKKQIAAMNTFLSSVQSNKKVSVTKSYKNLSHRVKLRYINLGKVIIQSMATLIASDDADSYIQDVLNHLDSKEPNIVLDGNFRQVMSGIVEAYNNAELWRTRREILSVVAPKISLKLMRLFIPDLTSYRFSAARFHAFQHGIGSRIEPVSKVIQRFDDNQIAHFVDYILSPHVCTDLPFGEKVLKLSSGIELFIPNTIRNMGATRIVDQYHNYCNEMCPGLKPLGKSTLFSILEACKASTRKSLQGINYFAAEAGEAFDAIQKMIEEKALAYQGIDRLIQNLKRSRFYLKSDYKVHISRSSKVADHCCVHALSDHKKRDFQQSCDHEHNESCAECLILSNTLGEIEQVLKETEKDEELLERTLTKFRSYRESIEAWKTHLLRSNNQDMCREHLLDNLSNDEIYMNLDWAMKFLPVKSREAQSDFFGKRGISWHITVVMKNKILISNEDSSLQTSDKLDDNLRLNDQEMSDISEESDDNESLVSQDEGKRFQYKIFVHVFDDCSQDSETVVAIINDVLARVKQTDPQIRKAFLRSDNAGCYHSANTIVSAKQVSDKSGIEINRIDFCDPQGGKGPCDRYAAVIKSNIRRYLNENHNVTNASEFIEACHSYKGVKGVVALECRIENVIPNDKKKCTIKQITNYYNFEYKPDGLLVHRAWNIGPGLLIPWSQLEMGHTVLNLISNRVDSFNHQWVETEDKHNIDSMDVDDCDLEEQDSLLVNTSHKKIYECDVEPGCIAAFLNFGSYMNHIVIGKHRCKPEKFSLKDTAMKMYHSKLEEIENRRIISIDINLINIVEDEVDILSEGWALPKRTPRIGFTNKQRQYLRTKFDDGVRGIRHWKPKEVVFDMESLKQNGKFYFSANEILNENQVRSYFSRLAQEKEKIPSKTSQVINVVCKKKLNINNSSHNEDQESDSEGELLEQDLLDTEAGIEEQEVFKSSCARAKTALQQSSLKR